METEGLTTTVINSTLTAILRNCTSLPGGCSESTAMDDVTTVIPTSTWQPQTHRVNCGPRFDHLCMNKGFCQYVIVGDYTHRFCNCVGAFTGPRCEFFDFAALGGSTQNDTISTRYIYAGVAIGILLLTILIAALYYYLRSRTYKGQLEKLDYVTTDGYHSSKETLTTRCGQLTPQRHSMVSCEFYNEDDVNVETGVTLSRQISCSV